MVSNSNGGIGFSSPKDLYNAVQGNKTEFVKIYAATYGQGDSASGQYQAEKVFNYMAGMDKDGTVGLTKEEYTQGLQDKKALAELKLDKIYSQYVPTDAREKFVAMTQEEKMAYLEGRIPHEPGREAEAHIQASIVLSSINRIDTEIQLLNEELKTQGVEPKPPKTQEEKVVDDMLLTYVKAEDLEKFKAMKYAEKVEYLREHIPHKAGTPEVELYEMAAEFLDEVRIIKDAFEEVNKTLSKPVYEINSDDKSKNINSPKNFFNI